MRTAIAIYRGKTAQTVIVNRMNEGVTNPRDLVTQTDMSRFESGNVLPPPGVMRRLCKALPAKPLELYRKADIDLLSVAREYEAPEPHKRRGLVKLQIWCTPDDLKDLDADKEVLGFRTRTAWLAWARLMTGYIAGKKRQNRAASLNQITINDLLRDVDTMAQYENERGQTDNG